MKPALMLLLCVAALADDRIARMEDPKLSIAQRNDACFALRGDKSGEVLSAMRQALSSDQLRACAAAGLREAGAVDRLTDALKDPAPEVRAAAARELGVLAGADAMESLARAARDPNALVAANAAYALTQYRDPGVLPYLLDLAKDGGMAGVLALTRAVELRDARALPIARELSLGSDPAVRMYAVNAIGELGDARDLPALKRIAASNERLSPNSRGFGLLPAIDISRAAQTAIQKIERRTLNSR